MHNNYYFLRQISTRLDEKLRGFTLVSCFSQSRDELVIEFNDSKSSFFIRASLLPEFSCLSFPAKFQRARKNSVDLFNDALMQAVTGITQYTNERSFAINLAGGYSLLFKMHGNRSNVLLTEGVAVKDIFRNHQENDFSVIPENLNKEIDWSREAFDGNVGKPDTLYFTFGKPVWTYLKAKGFDEADPERKWDLVRKTVQILEDPPKYFITEYNGTTHLALLEFGRTLSEYSDPFLAVNDFASIHASHSQFHKKKDRAITEARQEIKGYQKYLQTSNERLAEVEREDHFKIWADNLMANLHELATGMKSIRLSNVYNGELIDIPLDEKLSPQKNAERYYRKSKNRVIELEKLKGSIAQFNSKLAAVERKLESLSTQTDDRALNSFIEEEQSSISEKSAIPFWQFEFKGFTIWAGKDAKNNDELTLKWAHKNDLWLHARDVPGSHVIIRNQSGKPFPKDVIEYAASIAAWNSKRKTESLCPVIVTPKKFVRKSKGAPAGAVVVEREEVILVEPKQPVSNTH